MTIKDKHCNKTKNKHNSVLQNFVTFSNERLQAKTSTIEHKFTNKNLPNYSITCIYGPSNMLVLWVFWNFLVEDLDGIIMISFD